MHYRITLINASLRRRVTIELYESVTLKEGMTLDAALEALRLLPVFSVFETIATVEQVTDSVSYSFFDGSLRKEL